MSSFNPNISEFLSSSTVEQLGSSLTESEDSSGDGELSFTESGYEGSIDYRIRQLSYSSLSTLHTCPREYQLYKLRTESAPESEKSSITFNFGHIVGEGIQNVFIGLSWEEIVWKAFLRWSIDIFAEDTKAKKTFWNALIGIKKFISLRESGFLKDYELVWYEGKPAVELSFCINFPDSFRYRGHVDAVLKHIHSGKIIVLECKTTGMPSVNPATYKNSAQAIGYSIVLDAIFPNLSSYEVLYLVYLSGSREFETFPFPKTYLQRALWIRELLLDIESIKMYEDAGVYPMHGENCVRFGRECSYFQSCTLSTEYLAKPMSQKFVDRVEYTVNLTLLDLLDSQVKKAELPTELPNTESGTNEFYSDKDVML